MKRLIALFSVVVLFSCDVKKSSKPISYQIMIESDYNGKRTQSYEVIDNHEDLKKLYRNINDDLVPNIDFAKSRIVVLYMGEKNSGGYSIGIENIRQEKGKVIIKVKKNYPQGTVTMALTQPYVIAKINTFRKIEFEE